MPEFPNEKIKSQPASDRARFWIIDCLNARLVVKQPDIDNQAFFHGEGTLIRTYIIRYSFEKVILPEIDLVKKELTFKRVFNQDELWIDGSSYEIISENTATEAKPKYTWYLE